MSRIASREPTVIRLHSRLSVADLLWVANTRHGPGGHWFARPVRDLGDHDHLLEPAAAVEYLSTHGVPVPDATPRPADLAGLRVIREMVRSLLRRRGGWTRDVREIVRAGRYRLTEDLALEPEETGWTGFLHDLVPPLLEVFARRDRLRVCGNPMCRLVFIDSSKNRSRRWCDTAGCGNRFRVRRHRRSVSRAPAAAAVHAPP
jgi:hypothetical protein